MAKTKRIIKPKNPFVLEEPEAVYATRLRAIGNSRGVILNNEILSKAGLNTNDEIIVQAAKGAIIILGRKGKTVADLSDWDRGFREAKKTGSVPEKDLFRGMENKFDREEW